MANLRTLRKHIEYVCGDLAGECMIANAFDGKGNDEVLAKLITRLAIIQETALNRTYIKFDRTPRDFSSAKDYKKARAAYFRQAYDALLADFNKEIAEVVNSMNKDLK